MKLFMLLFFIGYTMETTKLLFDFRSASETNEWYTVNDDVMGGISNSNFKVNNNGTATFFGNVSPENNGGFASVRSLVVLENNSSFEGVLLRVRGDGLKYNLRFRTNKNFDGVAYQAKFYTKKDEWEIFEIPFDMFQPTFRGRYVPNQPHLKSDNISQLGFLISDKQFGEFKLDIDWIKFY